MRLIKQSYCVIILVFGLLQSAQAILPIEKLESVKGAKAYLVQTQALPMLDIEISIDAGDRFDPTGKSGLASMTAELMNYGARSSKGALSEAQIAERITFCQIGWLSKRF